MRSTPACFPRTECVVMFVDGKGSSARNNPALSNERRDSDPEICCWVGFKKQRNTTFRIIYLYILVLLLQWILRVKFYLFFSLSINEMRVWHAAIVCRSIFGAAGAVLGAHIFAVMWCINAPQGPGQRGVLSVTRASSALSFYFLLESLWAEPGAGSKARELFCCLWLSVKSLFLKGSRGVGLWFSLMHKAACGRTSEKILR